MEPVLGRVKWWSDVRGYGYVVGPDGTEYFVHHMDIAAEGWRSLAAGVPVRFLPGEGPRGPRARAVEPLDPAPGGGAAPTDEPEA